MSSREQAIECALIAIENGLSESLDPIPLSQNPPSTPTKCKRTGSSDNSNIFQSRKHPQDIHESINVTGQDWRLLGASKERNDRSRERTR
jgi:hypothetical protein